MNKSWIANGFTAANALFGGLSIISCGNWGRSGLFPAHSSVRSARSVWRVSM